MIQGNFDTASCIYFPPLKHIVPSGQLNRFAFQGFQRFLVQVLFLHHEAEHVFVSFFTTRRNMYSSNHLSVNVR